MNKVICESCNHREFYIYSDKQPSGSNNIWSICSNCGEVLRAYGN